MAVEIDIGKPHVHPLPASGKRIIPPPEIVLIQQEGRPVIINGSVLHSLSLYCTVYV